MMVDIREIAADIGVHFSDAVAAKLTREASKHANRTYGCCDREGLNRCSWRCWVKSRLSELGYLRAHCKGVEEIGLTVTLHVFNIHWADLPWMLIEENACPQKTNVARSKIIKTHLIPQPIDTVARRVAQPDHRKQL